MFELTVSRPNALPPGACRPCEVWLNNRLHVCYEELTGTLLVKWQGEVSSTEVRQGYACIVEMVRHFKPRKWLLDLHQRTVLRPDDQHWVFSHVFPEALRILKSNVFVALILPISLYQSLVDELQGDELMQGDNFMIIHQCLYPEEGRRWLEQMQREE